MPSMPAQAKVRLIRGLYARGYERAQVLELAGQSPVCQPRCDRCDVGKRETALESVVICSLFVAQIDDVDAIYPTVRCYHNYCCPEDRVASTARCTAAGSGARCCAGSAACPLVTM